MAQYLIEIWAPNAQSVELLAFGERLPMAAVQHPSVTPQGIPLHETGWWRLEDERLSAGVRYQVSVDAGPPLPDPRSESQPEGPHGPSEIVDHDSFQWTDQGFSPPPLESAIIYELHVGTFSARGTFDGVLEHLDHLVELGITHVELMPVCEFPGARGWGYDGVDLFAPHHAYGGPLGLKRLVNECHRRGLSVLLDVVYNHLGPSGNYLGQFGPYFTDIYHTPWGQAVNLDQAGSDEARRFFCDNALSWLRNYHFDGLRLDAIHAFHDNGAYHFLEELADCVAQFNAETGRRCVLIAESDLSDPRTTRTREAFGQGMDAQWCDDLHHAIHAYLTGEQTGYYADYGRLSHIAQALSHGFVYRGQFSQFRGRRHGVPGASPKAERLLAYGQTHDQVGNRARGDRLSHLLAPAVLEQVAALVICSPFIPMLFQGEEWAATTPFCYFTDHQEPELGRAVREGRRREFSAFGWDPSQIPDPQAEATFERSKLRWQELSDPAHASLTALYRNLIQFRRSSRDLLTSPASVEFDEQARWLRLRRGETELVLNFAAEPRVLPTSGGELRLNSAGASINSEGLHLPANSFALLQRAP